MRAVVVIGGALMLIGGVMQFRSVLMLRGRGPWRGAAVSASALAMFGLLAVTGVVLNGTVLSAVLIWVVAGAMWGGWWLTRRDQAGQGR